MRKIKGEVVKLLSFASPDYGPKQFHPVSKEV